MSGDPASMTGPDPPPGGSTPKTGEDPPSGVDGDGAFKVGGSPAPPAGDGEAKAVGTGDADATGCGVGVVLPVGLLDGAARTLDTGARRLETGLLSGVGRRDGAFVTGARSGAATFCTVVVIGCVVWVTLDSVCDTVVVTVLTTFVTVVAWVTGFTDVSTGRVTAVVTR